MIEHEFRETNEIYHQLKLYGKNEERAVETLTRIIKEWKENQQTLRDQLAMSCPHEFIIKFMECHKKYENLTYEEYLIATCSIRYRYADAMLKQRERVE